MKTLAEIPAETALAVSADKPEKHLANYIQKRLGGGKVVVDYWVEVMENPKSRDSDRLKASELLTNRGWGKPKETIAVEVVEGGLDSLPLEQLVAMAASWDAMNSVEKLIAEGQS